jgi:hypothetical protein
MSAPIKLKLYGVSLETSTFANEPYLQLEEAIDLSVTRSEKDKKELELTDDDFIEVVFDDDTTWFGDKETLRELFPNMEVKSRSGETTLTLPQYIDGGEETRGILKKLFPRLFKRFSKKTVDKTVKQLAEELEDNVLDKKIGLYRLTKAFALLPFSTTASEPLQHYLLLIHGTAASTAESFDKMNGTIEWDNITDKYGDNILAFQHRSLTKSPLDNVLDLVNGLPVNVSLDIISQSRGGLVGELLVRFIEDPNGFLPVSISLLERENRTADLAVIHKISQAIQSKKITIRKFVRSACAGRGTSLMGKRLDIFINTLLNFIRFSSSPVVSVIAGCLKAIIANVLKTRNNPDVLPGLEVQSTDSIFVKILNTPKKISGTDAEGFDNHLIVISGDSEFSLSLKGLLVILSNYFFKRKRNDFINDTASMYYGAKRKNAIQYFFDQGKNVHHFNYFKNEKTRSAIWTALSTEGNVIPGFKTLLPDNFQEIERAGILGLEYGRYFKEDVSGKKPIVILLPGIMGSFLERNNKDIWINYFNFAVGGLKNIAIDKNGVKATGLIKTSYKDLGSYLEAGYDVVTFPFDWRLTLTEAGNQLNTKITALMQYKQPIKLVGHSMGGLVIRELMINHTATWQQLNTQNGFITVLLGTPWLGSYRIPYVLAGMDSIIKQLSRIDFAHSMSELIDMFVKYPGLLELSPIGVNDIDFADKAVWNYFQPLTGYNWTIPDDKQLSAFKDFRTNVRNKLDGIDYAKVVYVAGRDKTTIDGLYIEDDILKFTDTPYGDQSVTWASGIPTGINKEKNLYYTDVAHGALACDKSLFSGIKDLLNTRTTGSSAFSRIQPAIVTTKRSTVAKETFVFESGEKGIRQNILGINTYETVEQASSPILKITVSRGDLIFAKYPVMIGHFLNDGLYSAENVVNKYLDNTLAFKHALGIYPGAVGTYEFFEDKNNSFHFPGSLVIGIGQWENLNVYQLAKAVEKAVAGYLISEWLPKVKRGQVAKQAIGISTVLIGAGYGRIPIESSCRAIIQGIINANNRVALTTNEDDLYISELEFLELFQDKSVSCFYSINKLVAAENSGLNLAFAKKDIQVLPGSRTRLMADAESEWWNRLTIISSIVYPNTCDETQWERVLSFYASTSGAREEKRELNSNLPLIENLLNEVSLNRRWSYEKARAIFELMMPQDFKENIRRNANLLWVLDKYTASFPWELMQVGNKEEKPLCISSKMIRQLATQGYTLEPNITDSNSVLIIGDPDLAGYTRAGQLDGAAKEAEHVYQQMNDANNGLQVELPVIRGNSDDILTALFKQDYKILHLAGHGVFDEKKENGSGMLIGKKTGSDEAVLLTPQQIALLPNPPELVFVNCCFLGRVNPYAEELSANRFKLAANIGTQLIESGAKAVIVAGWEIDDTAALFFAKVFYENMLQNQTLGDSVHSARVAVYEHYPQSNTWGAFQCYGQPDYTLGVKQPDTADNFVKGYSIAVEALNDLENLLSKCDVPFYSTDELKTEVKLIHQRIEKAGFESPDIIERLMNIYWELGETENAANECKKLFRQNNATYDVKSLERYQEILRRQALESVKNIQEPTKEDLAVALPLLDIALKNIDTILLIGQTGRRIGLKASLFKVKVWFATSVTEKRKFLQETVKLYKTAYDELKNVHSYTNWRMMEFFLRSEQAGKPAKASKTKFDTKPQIIKELTQLDERAEIQRGQMSEINYWLLSDKTSIALCLFLYQPTEEAQQKVLEQFEKIWKKAGSYIKKQRQQEQFDLLIHLSDFAGSKALSNRLRKIKNTIAGWR